ncbi:hypothetical protein PRUPE_3G185700 [Prunus persica]|uniref:Pectinesterase n=1 Tax=Prunus persica TaxID=3760 RepID=A0A251Q282_PRUPE|nr:hypothetical protein PRUPE_3G185700 [Prunus persica]
MSLKTTCLTYFVAIFAVLLASRRVIDPNSSPLKHIVDLSLATTSSVPSNIISYLIPNHIGRHHKKKDNGTLGSICDDFPRGVPPPDTNKTSYLCVDRNGCCNFTLVQAAVDAAPALSQKRTIIWINNGIYYEKILIPKNKPNITFQGQGYESTAIAWNDTANSSHGTFYSGSVQVFADNFVAKNISFMKWELYKKNLAPIPKPGDFGAQAVAIRISGDQAAFLGCGFFGAQDTLHDDKGRHYFKDCYVQGSIDFIFGNGRSLYENCQLISIANPLPPESRNVNGAITAHGRTSKDDNTGFAFVNCFIGGTGRVWLGRAWRPFSRVVFVNTIMADIIAPEGWNDFNDPTRDQTIFYGEYNCSGAGANMTMRAPFVQKLNDTEASTFLNVSWIDGGDWLQRNIN